MIKASIGILIAFLIGLAVTMPMIQRDHNQGSDSYDAISSRLDQLELNLNTEIEQRKILERQIEHERDQRLALADQISELNAHNDALNATIENRAFNAPNPMSRSGDYQGEIEMLLAAGFDSLDAERIAQMETDLQRQIISSRFGSQRINARDLFLEMNQTLRSELGDEKYELYLETTGRPTSVEVGQLLPESAGADAGLEVGDKIISYAGERVFSISDLQQASQDGPEGQSVVMEVDRDGIPVTLVVPRGRIGIAAGGFDFRRGRPID